MGGSLWNIWIAIVRFLEKLYDQNMGSENLGIGTFLVGIGKFPVDGDFDKKFVGVLGKLSEKRWGYGDWGLGCFHITLNHLWFMAMDL